MTTLGNLMELGNINEKILVISLLVVGIILISGCIDEEKTNSKTSTNSQPINKTSKETSASPSISISSPSDNYPSAAVPEISQSKLIPNEFEINITSYYFVYLRNNNVFHENTTKLAFDLVEKNYVIYHLAIKNNDTNTLNFSMNKLQLHTGDQIFTPSDPTTISRNYIGWVFSDIENENRLNDTLLHPDQDLKGIVIFQVENYSMLSDRSFSLSYNITPIPSTPIEKSLEALKLAEQFDYSIVFETPPYDMDRFEDYTYDPEPESPYVWANWVNRTVFEYFKKYDEISLPNENPEKIPRVEIAYAVKVIPEHDLTVFSENHSIIYEERNSGPYQIRSEGKYIGMLMHVVDDSGEELFNKSIDPLKDHFGLVMLDNKTYRRFSENMPNMSIPHATIVHFSFYSIYGWNLAMRLTFNNQDIILDEQQNITLARYDNDKFIS